MDPLAANPQPDQPRTWERSVDLPGRRVSHEYVFGGFNIRGTPPMSRDKVRSDVKVIKAFTDLAVMNEYRWDYYWRLLQRLVDTNDRSEWGTFPGLVRGVKMPVFGGQPCMWKKRYFRKTGKKVSLLHKGHRKISESRQLRGVELQELITKLKFWEATAHFVVKGDAHSDTRLRKSIMRTDLRNFRSFIMELMKSGKPIIFQGDLNIHKGTWAYRALMAIVRELGGRVVGTHGIEFTIIFDKHSDTKIVTSAVRVIMPKPKGPLNTDHEGRLTRFHLYRSNVA